METTTLIVNPTVPEIYTHGTNFYMQINNQGSWQQVDAQTVKLAIEQAGFSKKAKDNEKLSAVKQALLKIKTQNRVDQVLTHEPKYQPGVHIIKGKKSLVLQPEPIINSIITDADTAAVDELLKEVKQDLPIPEMYYHNTKHIFLLKDQNGYWVELNNPDLRLHLVAHGLSKERKEEDSFLTEVEDQIRTVQLNNAIDWSGEIAGWKAGLHHHADHRFLVKRGVQLIVPAKGNCGDLRKFFETLLPGEQVEYFYGWLKHAIEGLYHSHQRYGKAVILTGPSNCGKTLCREIVTLIMGGRECKPHSFLQGGTQFNEDLSGAELWHIDDENSANINHWDRRRFGSCIKTITADKSLRVHGKGQKAIVLPVHVRLMICTNCEPQNLMIIPPQDESLKDKILIFGCGKATIPATPSGLCSAEYKIIDEVFKPQIAAFIHWLLNEYQVPAALVDSRYGIATYQHQEVQDELFAKSHEGILLELIWKAYNKDLLETSKVNAVIRDSITGRVDTHAIDAWRGTATDLSAILTDTKTPFNSEARKILDWGGSCGTYLGSLKDHPKHGKMFKYYRTNNGRSWGIAFPPQNDTDVLDSVNW